MISYLWKVNYSTVTKQHHVNTPQGTVYRVSTRRFDISAPVKLLKKKKEGAGHLSYFTHLEHPLHKPHRYEFYMEITCKTFWNEILTSNRAWKINTVSVKSRNYTYESWKKVPVLTHTKIPICLETEKAQIVIYHLTYHF